MDTNDVVKITKKKIVDRVSSMLDADMHPQHVIANVLLRTIFYINTQKKPHEEIENLHQVNTILFKLYFLFTGKSFF